MIISLITSNELKKIKLPAGNLGAALEWEPQRIIGTTQRRCHPRQPVGPI